MQLQARSSEDRTLNASPFHNRFAVLAAGLIAFASCIAPAAAQLGGGIDPSKVEVDKTAIGDLIKTSQPGLTGDSAAIRRSRNALVQPLRSGTVTAQFRSEYSAQLLPVIAPLVGDARDEVAINALRLAGELGTRKAMDQLDAGLKDKRPSVRTMAALMYARAFGTMRAGSTHLVQANTDPAIVNLLAALDAEQNPLVLEAIVAAFDSAARIPDATMSGKGIDALATAIARLAQRPAAADVNAALFAGAKGIFDVQSATGRATATQQKEFGGAAGEIVARVNRVLETGTPTDQEREALARLADQANVIYVLAARSLGKDAPGFKLGEAIRAGGDAAFKKDAATLLLNLRQPPFGFPADRFKTK